MRRSASFRKQATFDSLLDYYNLVFKICLGFTKNPWDAEDLMHEVYVRALKKIDSLRNHEQSKAWLLRIARNTCLNFVTRQRLHRFLSPSPENPGIERDSPEWQMIQSEHFQFYKTAVGKLPKRQREVFILREYGDLSYGEISELLKINEGTVMSRLNRARHAIKAKIEQVTK
jgi:RNA polymerase sigma-70 factor (ECF subfamily)